MKCSAGWTAIGLMVLTLLPSQVIAQATGALQLEEVLRSVDQHFPKIRAAFEKTEAARAKQLQSEGAFDLNLHGKAQHLVRGKFPSSSIDTWVEQPTTLWGLKVEGGYRNASGFPIYNGQNVTSTNGEVRIGISIPLLRDRAIDDNRFELKNAKLGVERTSQEQRWVRLQSRLKAASVYLKWVALGQKRVVAERLLQIASVRQAGMRADRSRPSNASTTSVSSSVARNVWSRRRSNSSRPGLSWAYFGEARMVGPIFPPAVRFPTGRPHRSWMVICPTISTGPSKSDPTYWLCATRPSNCKPGLRFRRIASNPRWICG